MKRRGVRLFGSIVALLVGAVCAAPLGAQPSAIGEWSSVFTWGQGGGFEAIHVHMLPTGKVLFWQTWRESVGLWDPVTDTFSTAAFPNPSGGADPYNPFCSGHAWLPDGRLFVGGGHITNDNGLRRANIYNPFTNTWANNVPNMPSLSSPPAPYSTGQNGRWYPAATTLGTGDILMMSGGMNGDPIVANPSDPPEQWYYIDSNPLPQVYEVATNSWRSLTTAYKDLPLYPRTFLAPNGNVVSLANYSDKTEFLDTTGTGQWSAYTTTTLDNNLVNYGPAVMYDAGKVAYIGGGYQPTQNISLIDLNDPTPTWTYGADDMAQGRRQNNATILADGTVLITGGTSTIGWNDPAGLISVAELWDPITEQVTQVAQANPSIYRGYHSTGLLLPDGRVLVTGGDHDYGGFQQNLNAEIYSPAYLFNGPRPTITSAPATAELGDTIFVATPDGADIADVTFIVPGSVTHAQNWTQRADHLHFTETAGGLNVTLPYNPNEAPPGYYMMFLINDNGVPSVAKWIQAQLPSTGPLGDYNADGIVNGADYTVWRDHADDPTYDLLNEGATEGMVTEEDYAIWRLHFGETEGAGAGEAATAAVPEPASIVLTTLAALGGLGLRRRFGRNG